MKFQTPPGMRDFYPDEMRLQNWLFEHWRAVSRAFGFVEYEGPAFEYLDLYRAKSGDAIVEELFHFNDRGGREFALRPETTPTLARMVAARANALPRPIKWFSISRMCRAERPQRGRLREFYQWNIDTLGVESVLADAEVIAAGVAFFQRLGLDAHDIVFKVSSRAFATAVLQSAGLAADQVVTAFGLLDKAEKIEPAEFQKLWAEQIGTAVPAERVQELIATATLEDCTRLVAETGPDGDAVAGGFTRLWNALQSLGVGDYCEFDLRTVRGLAYYTGPVFEAFARQIRLSALLGGGRYDSLTAVLGGPQVTGVGFGMGDSRILLLLEELGKLPALADELDAFVIDAGEEFLPAALQVVGELRRAGLAVEFAYKRQGLSKQMKQATNRQARRVIIVGEEYGTDKSLVVKDMGTGTQRTIAANALVQDPRRALESV